MSSIDRLIVSRFIPSDHVVDRSIDCFTFHPIRSCRRSIDSLFRVSSHHVVDRYSRSNRYSPLFTSAPRFVFSPHHHVVDRSFTVSRFIPSHHVDSLESRLSIDRVVDRRTTRSTDRPHDLPDLPDHASRPRARVRASSIVDVARARARVERTLKSRRRRRSTTTGFRSRSNLCRTNERHRSNRSPLIESIIDRSIDRFHQKTIRITNANRCDDRTIARTIAIATCDRVRVIVARRQRTLNRTAF